MSVIALSPSAFGANQREPYHFRMSSRTFVSDTFMGSYKLNMGARRPGQTKSPVQMVKKDFRMIGAVVRTPDRGNWFFRLVGPDETVLAAKEPFFQMLEGVE